MNIIRFYKDGAETHRFWLWDSTNMEDMKELMGEHKADLLLCDPPYWMKKNILNDDIKAKDFIEWNKKWFDVTIEFLKEYQWIYVWWNDDSILNLHANLFQRYMKDKLITFKNIITWNKWTWFWQHSEQRKKYAVSDEKCLFYIKWDENKYNEAYEKIRIYLYTEFKKINSFHKKEIVKILWFTSTSMIGHWTNKLQWNIISNRHYNIVKQYCEEHDIDALKRKYEEIQEDRAEAKKMKRQYFDNIHDNFNNVWNILRARYDDGNDKWNKYIETPKPFKVFERIIKTSCPENWIVLDPFIWSGTSFIVWSKTNRRIFGMEKDEKQFNITKERILNLNYTFYENCI